MYKNRKDNLDKFDAIHDEGIFHDYSLHGKSYRMFHKRLQTFKEYHHVVFNETNPRLARKEFVDDIAEYK